MQDKPIYLILFPILALGIALSFPIQIYYLYKIPLVDIQKVFSMLTPLNILTMSVLLFCAAMTIKMTKHIYKVIPILLVIIFANNAVVGLYGTDYTVIQVALSFILFAISLKPFYSKEIRAVIYNPRLRWWLTPKRYRIQKPVQLNNELLEIYSDTMNVSATGLFTKLKDLEIVEKMKLDSIVELKLMAETPISLQAKVVRKSDGSTPQPIGVGLEIIQNEQYKKEYLPWLKKETK